MQRIILLLIIAAFGWYGYTKYQDRVKALRAQEAEIQSSEPRAVSDRVQVPKSEAPVVMGFKCDGRVYCSQMTSCAEATFFLKNCPGTKMDGDNDGIPCESQWCRK